MLAWYNQIQIHFVKWYVIQSLANAILNNTS